MPIPDLPLFKHRDTVVTPADQNQFVTQFENTMDTMSYDVIPAINDAITDINSKVTTATTARDESVSAKNIAVAAKDEALTAVATLQEGAIDDTTIAPNKAFSNQYTNNNFVKLTGNQTVAGVKTFTSSPIVPAPTTDFQVATKNYVDVSISNLDVGVPSGAILMWSGSIASIPSGWALCNGTNGTPDLRDRFIVGAGSSYNVGATGGSKDAIVVGHTHTGTAASGGGGQSFVTGRGASDSGSGTGIFSNGSFLANYASTSAHSHSLTINSTGSSGTNANLPPYYALAFIMKI